MGYSRKKNKWELRTQNFQGQGYQRNSMWIFWGLPKNEVGFPRVKKKKQCGISRGVLVFGLGISEGSDTILWNFQGLSFTLKTNLSRISRNKVKNEKFQGFFKKSMSSTPLPLPTLFVFFFWNSPKQKGHVFFI